MRVSAKTDYALRAAVELASAQDQATPVKGERLATSQNIPLRFLENILLQLRHAGIIESRRGADGGYKLARPAADITLADVIRAIDGPLAGVSGARPETLDFKGASEPLREVWVAVRASLRSVLEQVSLADVAANELPDNVRALVAEPDAWISH
jgi:Rrf2 family protein